MVLGRREDTLMVGRRLFDLWDLEKMVAHFPCRRFWVAGALPDGVHFWVEEEKGGERIEAALVKMLEDKYQMRVRITTVPRGTLCDRRMLLAVETVGKPRYLQPAGESGVQPTGNFARL